MATAIIVLSIICLALSALGLVVAIATCVMSGARAYRININVSGLVGVALSILCLVYFL